MAQLKTLSDVYQPIDPFQFVQAKLVGEQLKDISEKRNIQSETARELQLQEGGMEEPRSLSAIYKEKAIGLGRPDLAMEMDKIEEEKRTGISQLLFQAMQTGNKDISNAIIRSNRDILGKDFPEIKSLEKTVSGLVIQDSQNNKYGASLMSDGTWKTEALNIKGASDNKYLTGLTNELKSDPVIKTLSARINTYDKEIAEFEAEEKTETLLGKVKPKYKTLLANKADAIKELNDRIAQLGGTPVTDTLPSAGEWDGSGGSSKDLSNALMGVSH